jgi:hypothetical protein
MKRMVNLVAIWYNFSVVFGAFHQEKSGNPAADRADAT